MKHKRISSGWKRAAGFETWMEQSEARSFFGSSDFLREGTTENEMRYSRADVFGFSNMTRRLILDLC